MNNSSIAPADYPLLFTDRRPFLFGIRGGVLCVLEAIPDHVMINIHGCYEEPACMS